MIETHAFPLLQGIQNSIHVCCCLKGPTTATPFSAPKKSVKRKATHQTSARTMSTTIGGDINCHSNLNRLHSHHENRVHLPSLVIGFHRGIMCQGQNGAIPFLWWMADSIDKRTAIGSSNWSVSPGDQKVCDIGPLPCSRGAQ